MLGFNAAGDDGSGGSEGSENSASVESVHSGNDTVSAALEAQTNASGSLCLIAGILAIAWAVIMIVLRFLNIGLLNLGSKYFLAVVNKQIPKIIIMVILFTCHSSLGRHGEHHSVHSGTRCWLHYSCFRRRMEQP